MLFDFYFFRPILYILYKVQIYKNNNELFRNFSIPNAGEKIVTRAGNRKHNIKFPVPFQCWQVWASSFMTKLAWPENLKYRKLLQSPNSNKVHTLCNAQNYWKFIPQLSPNHTNSQGQASLCQWKQTFCWWNQSALAL